MKLGDRLAAENDSHCHKLHAPSRILRMILIISSTSVLPTPRKKQNFNPNDSGEKYAKPPLFRYKKRPKPTPCKNFDVFG